MTDDTRLPYRVDVFCSGGWQHCASFAGETDAYEYGDRCQWCGCTLKSGYHNEGCPVRPLQEGR